MDPASRQTSGDKPDSPATGDEKLHEFLLRYDDVLADGASEDVDQCQPTNVTPRTAQRIRQARHVLDALERSRRRSSADSAAESIEISVNSAEEAESEDPQEFIGLDSTDPSSQTLGRFHILRELGRGAFGVVFLARDPVLGRKVALKVPRPEALVTPSLRARFMVEAQTAARLTHPNLVPVYESGEVGPICYIAAMYCEGQTLAAWLADYPRGVRCDVAAGIVAQLADGVAYAHRQGILHRDIKPTNVLLERRDEAEGRQLPGDSQALRFTPRLTDFGLAKVEEGTGQDTHQGVLLGTPAYMAPEQADRRPEAVSRATDVYALGALLYELLTGRPAFQGTTDLDTLHRVLTEEPAPPRKLRRDVPRDLEAITLKCMEKNPAIRYADCHDLAADLRRYMAGDPTWARPLSPWQRIARWARKRPASAGLIAVSVVALLTIFGGSYLYTLRLVDTLKTSESNRLEAVAARAETEEHRQLAEASRNEALRERDVLDQYLYAARIREAFQVLGDGNATEVTKILDQYQDGERTANLRGFEWHYLKRSLHGERAFLKGHVGEVYGVAFSPDGRLLLSGGEDGTIRLWDPGSGKALRTIEAHKSCTNDFAFTPDGKLLASASCDHTVKIWDTSTWQLVATCQADAPVLCVACSPDGKMIATGDSQYALSVWTIPGGEVVKAFTFTTGMGINSVSWSPDGQFLAAPAEGALRVWSTSTWEEVNNQKIERLFTANFSPDSSRLISINSKDTVRIIDLTSKSTVERFFSPVAGTHHVLFMPHVQRLLTCGDDRCVRIWNLSPTEREYPLGGAPTTRQVDTLIGHQGRIQDAALSPDGRTLATASYDGLVGLWDLTTRGGTVPKFTCRSVAYRGIPWQCSLAPDLSELAVSGDERRITTWRLEGNPAMSSQSAPLPTTCQVIFGPHCERLFTRDLQSGEFGFCSFKTPDIRRVRVRGIEHVTGVNWSNNGRYATILGAGNELTVVNTENGDSIYKTSRSSTGERTQQESRAKTESATPSNDGQWLASDRWGFLNIASSKVVPYPLGQSPDGGTFFSSAGQPLFVNTYQNTAYLIDPAEGKIKHTLHLPNAATALAASPDSLTLAIACRESVTLWQMETGQQLASFLLPADTGNAILLSFSQDGQHLAAVTLQVIDAKYADLHLYIW